jgi:hypothetical protein
MDRQVSVGLKFSFQFSRKVKEVSLSVHFWRSKKKKKKKNYKVITEQTRYFAETEWGKSMKKIALNLLNVTDGTIQEQTCHYY